MLQKVFIQSNKKQALGAQLAKFALSRHTPSLPVEIIMVEEVAAFQKLVGASYLRKGRRVAYDPKDLQSFTLTRFMPPELMGYSGKALVIDPDIFALDDITPLFEMDMQEKAVLACRKGEAWDSSVMVLDCTKLKHWNIEQMVENLITGKEDYSTIMTLAKERVQELPRIWNNLDTLTKETKMLHTTNRLTQPWKTGLPRDFTINPLPKLFGFIPREPIHKLLGKYPTHYQSHSNKEIERFFFKLVKDALAAGAISEERVRNEIALGNIRKDFLEKLATAA